MTLARWPRWPMLAALASGIISLPGLGCGSAPPANGASAGIVTAPTPAPVGSGLVEVPDPLSPTNPLFPMPTTWPGVPAAGQSYVDPNFGTTQTRAVATLQLRHEYSRHDPFNRDHSLVLLYYLPDAEWRVYRTQSVPYDQPPALVATLQIEEPRWDPASPALLWGTRGLQVISVDLGAGGAETVRKDFTRDATIAPLLAQNPDIYRVTMKDEGETSRDKRSWAFILQGTAEDYRARYIFTWDQQQDRVLGVYTVAASQPDIDWVGMSPLGNWVLIGGSPANTGDLVGLVMANKELTQFHRIDYATGHADVGLDTDGREVIVMQNVQTDFVDLIPIDLSTQPILEAGGSYAGTGRVPLVRLYYASDVNAFGGGVHISCNAPGLCVISTTTDQGVPERNWLDRKIVLTTLDRTRPRTYYLARVFGTKGNPDAYWEETHASLTTDGSRVVWATNWSQDLGQERVWMMELTIPGAR
jgi:hypothetical protein